jgi:MYXO-CTERM domain-containing protein
MLKKTVLFAVTSILIASYSQAALVSTDWKVEGDKLSTLHQETGLEWLNLDVTRGMSYTGVEVDMQENGSLVGWRFPTNVEYVELISGDYGFVTQSAIDNKIGGDILSGSRFSQTENHSSFLSLFVDSGNAYGVHKTSYGALKHSGVRSDLVKSWLRNNMSTPLSTSINSGFGFWLVSDGGVTLSSINDPMLNSNNSAAPVNSTSNVPVNIAFGGLAMLGLGLGAFRRRKSK